MKLAIILLALVFAFPQAVKAEQVESVHYLKVIDNSIEKWEAKKLYFEDTASKDERTLSVFQNLFSKEEGSFIPKDVKVLNVETKNKHLIINFSEEILNYGGSYYEQRLLAQILKTAAYMEEVEKITICVNGKVAILPEGTITDGECIYLMLFNMLLLCNA